MDCAKSGSVSMGEAFFSILAFPLRAGLITAFPSSCRVQRQKHSMEIIDIIDINIPTGGDITDVSPQYIGIGCNGQPLDKNRTARSRVRIPPGPPTNPNDGGL
jgi:hypothetical protein